MQDLNKHHQLVKWFHRPSLFLTMVNVSSSASASLLFLGSTGTSCIRDNILAAAFLLASFLDVPLPEEEQGIMSHVADV